MIHSRYGPSAADRWVTCPGSQAFIKLYPEPASSDYADEGSAAHALLSDTLRDQQPADTYVGTTYPAYPKHPVTSEMAAYVQDVAERVLSHYDPAMGDKLYIDQLLDISAVVGVDDAVGTLDVSIWKPATGSLIVIDFKYGQGVRVEAERNFQMMLYALGQLYALPPEMLPDTVTLVIDQPRLRHNPHWIISVDDLMTVEQPMFAQAAAEGLAMEEAHEATGTVPLESLVPSKKGCQWCPAKVDCPAMHDMALEQAKVLFEQLGVTADPSRVAELMDAVPIMEQLINAVKVRAEEMLNAGLPVPGYKLVMGSQGNRAWSDAAEAEKILKATKLGQDVIYKKVIISPTQAEKLMTEKPKLWKRALAIITRSPGKPVVAPASDKRDTFTPVNFEDETDYL